MKYYIRNRPFPRSPYAAARRGCLGNLLISLVASFIAALAAGRRP